ncbi:MAG TPA: hypothetical protein PKA66_02635 [Gemmatimonadales bacterium]|nr:hypothetical protein [Gemmatimonadales bacterium]
MAVSNRHLGILAGLAVVLACWSLFDVESTGIVARRWTAEEDNHRMALRDSAYRLGLQVRTALVRDQVDSALKSYLPGQTPPVIVIGDEAPTAAALAESLFATLPAPSEAEHAMRLVIVEKKSPNRWPAGTITSFALLPSTPADGGCTVVRIAASKDSALSGFEARYWRDAPFEGAAGPCWFLARFGEPGPQVRKWLDSRYWDVAGSIPPNDRRLVYGEDDLRDAGVFERLFGSVATKFYGESATLEGCAGRRPELCEASFLASPYPAGLLPEGVAGNNRFNGYMLFRNEGSPFAFYAVTGSMLGVPRAASEALLAMMLDDLGPARFAEFWTSPAPVAEAFESVAGMSLGDWYRIQLRHQMAAAGVPEPREATFWPSALGILALALGGSLLLGARRQVR